MRKNISARPRNISRISKIMEKKVKLHTPKWWRICFLILAILFTLSLIGNVIYTYKNYKYMNRNLNNLIRTYGSFYAFDRNAPKVDDVAKYIKEKTTVNVALSFLLNAISIISIIGLLLRKIWMHITFFAIAIICCFISAAAVIGFKQMYGNPNTWFHVIILSLSVLVITALLTKRFFKIKQYAFAIPIMVKPNSENPEVIT